MTGTEAVVALILGVFLFWGFVSSIALHALRPELEELAERIRLLEKRK